MKTETLTSSEQIFVQSMIDFVEQVILEAKKNNFPYYHFVGYDFKICKEYNEKSLSKCLKYVNKYFKKKVFRRKILTRLHYTQFVVYFGKRRYFNWLFSVSDEYYEFTLSDDKLIEIAQRI